MKHYPSISSNIAYSQYVYAFDKLDGSNIRAEWNRKNGFFKFGSRTKLIDRSTPILGESIDLITNTYGEELDRIFSHNKYETVTCFFEFYGNNSFAGHHEEEEHKVILFDIAPLKKGFIPPHELIRSYGSLRLPKIVYSGYVDIDFVKKVRNSEFNDITFEGVVCKTRAGKTLDYFKIKTQKWLDKLKTYCKGDEEKIRMLS